MQSIRRGNTDADHAARDIRLLLPYRAFTFGEEAQRGGASRVVGPSFRGRTESAGRANEKDRTEGTFESRHCAAYCRGGDVKRFCGPSEAPGLERATER